MENNITPLNILRPEHWSIHVKEMEYPMIFCFYSEKYTRWLGAIYARSLEELQGLTMKARETMRLAKKENREVCIWA